MPRIKILCLSDIHNNNQFLQTLNEYLAKSDDYCSSDPRQSRGESRIKLQDSSRFAAAHSNNKYDLVLCAGDVISRPNKNALEFLNKFIDLITNLHQTKLFMVHGNNESGQMIDLMRKKKVLIHLKEKKYKGLKFFGIGGWMEDIPEISNLKSKISNSILLTHLPPKRQPISNNFHKSQSISDNPLIHLCGHIHSPGSIWRIGETLVIKIPSAMYGGAAVLQMPGRKIKFITL